MSIAKPQAYSTAGKSKSTTKTVLVIVLTVVAVLLLLLIMSIYFARRKPARRDFRSGEPLLFNLDTLKAATNNFLAANKLGEGGFGPVYKGILRDEKQIAVKRLSRSSGQVLGELRNKVVLFAKYLLTEKIRYDQILYGSGYMAPECARHGHFSTKSDVFSYGVLVLEILTGRRTNGFQGSGQAADLLSNVLQHWNEGMALQMIDRSLGDRYTSQEVLRCIHIGLLCIQEDPQERPDMASIVLMLTSYSVSLPAPSMPAFFVRGGTTSESEVKDRNMGTGFSGSEDSSGSTARLIPTSINGLSITEMEPR
ncbi:cysteine-rich receptor-like protein kinase 29 [Phoenix dactylifera]|uniref:Cysteine-rich receptor-like protein kinase 29 n=1 Tax=Phoenix dactylifera TaxID=42345 RepID=A0A8B9A6A5_PHODC|nr:cysteine-rich receptor-like protein kinase 29 [Phoenix dactylifera]